MGLNIKVLNSCKFLSVTADQYDKTVNGADIVIENVDPNISGSYTTAISYTNGKGQVNIPISNLSAANGVFKVCVVEAGATKACKPVLVKCDIDCCLVKLTDELIDCSCDCPRCASTMAKAQKIFLLLASAQSAVEIAGTDITNTGYNKDILSKYNKTKEICDNSCGCDC